MPTPAWEYKSRPLPPAEPPEAVNVEVIKMRREIEAVRKERDVFIAHVNEVHERLAAERSKYPPASVVGILRLTLDETTRERDLLRQHVEELHRRLADRAFEEAATRTAAAKAKAQPDATKKTLSKADREEARKRIKLSIEKSKKGNFEKWQEEMRKKEEDAEVEAGNKRWAGKAPKADIDARFEALERAAKTWAEKQNKARSVELGKEPKPPLPGATEPKKLGTTAMVQSMTRLAKPKLTAEKKAPVDKRKSVGEKATDRAAWGSRLAASPRPDPNVSRRERPASARGPTKGHYGPWDTAPQQRPHEV